MSKKKTTTTPDPPEVLELFETIAHMFPGAVGFDGTIMRCVGAKYAKAKDFFSGAGAAKCGGRWNRVGMEAIYASLDVITATHEAYQNFVAFGFPLTSIQPRVTAGATVSLEKVLELTDAKVRSRIGFTLTELIHEDWRGLQAAGDESWTQAIGRGCLLAGFEAIIVPSARHRNGKNIVIFPGNLPKTSEIKIQFADQLPT